MKILFICGSLEPGRDGVGDHTRRLAGELMRSGNSIALAALKELKLDSALEEFQFDGNTKIPVLRIPFNFSNKKRSKLLIDWINDFSPNLISLQYVPYSFSKYGIPLTLGLFLRKLSSNVMWQVMVHEPFLGTDVKGWKNQIIKSMQIFSLHQLEKRLRPILFHTSNPHYQKRLKNINIDSRILSLFGNIEIGEPKIEALGKEGFNKNPLSGIYFGSAPQIEHHNYFANEIKNYCQLKLAKLQLIFCGNLGTLGEKFIVSIQNACGGQDCEIISLGTLPVEELSSLFISSDFGISRVPPIFLGKSGSAISMLEHGLPVWVPLGKDQGIEENLDFRTELCFRNLSELGSSFLKLNPINRVPQISERFLTDMQELIEVKKNIEAQRNLVL